MIYLNNFDTHTSYEEKLNVGGIDFKIPNVSYCNDVKDVHFNPYNLIKFYVGEITGTTPQTVSIYTDGTNHLDVTVNGGNKWYTYVLPKDKGLFRIEGDSVKKVNVKADISLEGTYSYPNVIIIPKTTIEASFKGSNTSNVTNMSYMFNGCSGLTSLDLSSFDTIKVTDMNNMFANCGSLKSLDLSGWNTSNVINMYALFYGCSGLTSLNLSSFNTINVNGMTNMFENCSNLTHLDLRNFNTSNVIYMNGMFGGCSGLTSLDLSGWDTSKVTNMSDMFRGCTSLTSIRMKGCSEATINKIRGVIPSSASITT